MIGIQYMLFGAVLGVPGNDAFGVDAHSPGVAGDAFAVYAGRA